MQKKIYFKKALVTFILILSFLPLLIIPHPVINFSMDPYCTVLIEAFRYNGATDFI